MKRSPIWSASSEASDSKTIKISRSEPCPQVQLLIEHEVRKAAKQNGTKLQRLLETVLYQQVGYESSIEKLEARINMVTKRPEAALAFMAKTQKKSPQPAATNVKKSRSRSKVETTSDDTESMDFMDKDGQFFQMMDSAKKTLKEVTEDSQAVKAAIEDLNEGLPPPVLTPYGSPQAEGVLVKKESEDKSTPSAQAEPELEKLHHPPLPATPFPSVLNAAAASYSIPERPELHLGIIKNHVGFSALWNVAEKDLCAPPMDSYSIYMTTEKRKGSRVFANWINVGELRAMPLPMCATIEKYKPGHTVCVTVVGKDKFGRFGPFSEVVTVALPD